MEINKSIIMALGLFCLFSGLLLLYLGLTGTLAFRTSKLEIAETGEKTDLQASWNINDIVLPLLGVIEVDPKGRIDITITVKNTGTTPLYYAPSPSENPLALLGESWLIALVYKGDASPPAEVAKYFTWDNAITVTAGSESGVIQPNEEKTFKTMYTFSKDFVNTEWYIRLYLWDEIKGKWLVFSTADNNMSVKVVYNPQPQVTFNIAVTSGALLSILGVALTLYGKIKV